MGERGEGKLEVSFGKENISLCHAALGLNLAVFLEKEHLCFDETKAYQSHIHHIIYLNGREKEGNPNLLDIFSSELKSK